MLRRSALAALSSALLSCAGAPPAARPAAATTSASAAAPPAPPAPARWEFVDVPPSDADDESWKIPVPGGLLRVDRIGMRWLDGDAPRRASAPDPARHTQLVWMDGAGLVAVDADRKVRLASDPLAPWQVQSELPDGIWPDDLNPYRGGLAGPGVRGAWAAADLRTWRRIPPLEGRSPHDVLIGRDGAGIALFYPQAIATTSDGGASWKKLADEHLEVHTLWLHDGRVTLLPGTQAQQSLDWKHGAADFVPAPEPSKRVSKPTHKEEKLPFQVVTEGKPQRYPVELALSSGLASLVGDQVVALASASDRPVGWTLGVGALGAGVTFRPGQPPFTCRQSSLRMASCGQAVAPCPAESDRDAPCLDVPGTALVCEGQAIVRPLRGKPRRLQLPSRTLALAWDGDRLLSLHDTGVENGPNLSALATSFPDDQEPSQTPLSIGFTFPVGTTPELVGSCDGSKPVWLLARGQETIVSLLDGTTFVPRGFSLPAGTVSLGRDPSGALVSGELGRRSLRRLLPDGTAVDLPLPFALGSIPRMAGSLAAGRALLRDEAGLFFQTDDAGATFSRVRGPSAAPEDSALLCGENRCLLGSTRVRIGWGAAREDERPMPEPGYQEAETFDHGRPTPKDPLALLGCVPDASLDPRIPGKTSRVHALAPGAQAGLFSAIGANGELQRFWLDGRADGSVTERPLRGPPPTSITVDDSGTARRRQVIARMRDELVEGSFPFILGGGDLLATDTLSQDAPTPMPLLWQSTERGPLHRAWLPVAQPGSELVRVWLRGNNIAGMIRGNELTLHIFSASGAVRTHALPPSYTSQLHGESPWGYVVEHNGGLVLFTAGPDDGGKLALRFLSFGPGRPTIQRTVYVESFLKREQGWGLWSSNGEVSLAVLDTTEVGGAELRLHRLAPSLAPGPGVAVPGVRSAPHERLRLPACGAGPLPAGQMDIFLPWLNTPPPAPDARTLVARRIRYDDRRACVVSEAAYAFTRSLHQETYEQIFQPGLTAGVELRDGALRGVRCKGLPDGIF